MDVMDAIRKRRSVREFSAEPVPRKVLEEILEAAVQAPSAMNTQPWEFTVISGRVLEDIKRTNVEKLNRGEIPHPEYMVLGWPFDSVYRRRQVELAKQIFQHVGIPKGDKDGVAKWMERGFRFFDAPAVIVLSVDGSLSETGPALDVGAVMQNICLAALPFGLGTCIDEQGAMYPEVFRQYAGIPESKRIMVPIAIGYPAPDAPANRVRSGREPLHGITSWCGFD
ncbi:MAG: nitroreductase [Deltaproteobacteria bacterium]|nr:nitroreductase [Deltaproteobacteria bacterium]